VIRSATLDDVDAIATLVRQFVVTGDLLPRSAESIQLTINDWIIGLLDGELVGIGSLLVYTPVLAEVRSLAVLGKAQGTGIGRSIVTTLIDMGKARHIPTIFALTRAVRFFEKLGFTVTEKENFPEKIWHACRLCPIQDNCDEVAVVMPLEVV
jgi:amino-acid N-acetyltransferase